jgi:uncharacterized membrane protein AbrB (regulator of aidB expression)
MKARLRAFARFWYDFVVGDDWRVAAGVVTALAITYGVSHAHWSAAWWIVPVAVAVLLVASVWRAVPRPRGARRGTATPRGAASDQ